MNKQYWIVGLFLFLSTFSGCLQPADDGDASLQVEDPTLDDYEFVEDLCIVHDDVERCWFMVVPASLKPEDCREMSCPLLFDLHAYMERPIEQYEVSKMAELAVKENAITVYPLGQEDYSWNAGWCCGLASERGIDDVGYILNIIEYMIDSWHIDSNRVYLTGWSNGCTLAQKITSEASEYIAAMSCMAHYLDNEVHSSYSPVPIMEIHGTLDQWVPYGSQLAHSIVFEFSLEGDEGAIQNLEKWADANMCEGSSPAVLELFEDYSVIGYTECANGVETVLVTLNLAGHNPYSNEYTGTWEGGPTLYSNPTGIDVSLMTWEFLSQFSKS